MLEVVVGVANAIGIVFGLWYIKRTLERRLNELTTEALAFYQQEKTDLLGYYAKEKQDVIDNLPGIMGQFGDMMFQKIKGSVGGLISGQVRLDEGLQKAITTDLVHMQNPLLGGILDSFPAAKKFVTKNPNAIPQIMQLLGGFAQGAGPQQGLNPQSVQDRLRSMRY